MKKAALEAKKAPSIDACIKGAVKEAVAEHHMHGLPIFTHKDGVIWKVYPNGTERPVKHA